MWMNSSKINKLFLFAKRLKIPNEYKELALLLDDCFDDYITYLPKNIDDYDTLLALVQKLDIRKEERLKSFMSCVYASEVIHGFEEHKFFFEDLYFKVTVSICFLIFFD